MYQLESLFNDFDNLQKELGDPKLKSVYGAGNIFNPDFYFIFMNPTGRNISAFPSWNGIRAPWLGTKLVWKIFYQIGKLSEELFIKTQKFKPVQWSESFAESLYEELSNNSIYITNLAKCTQVDARPLPNTVFKKYLDLALNEIKTISPKKVITFGNQVSSILLNKKVSVSSYGESDSENIIINQKEYSVYPLYYPVGQGQRNMPLTIARLSSISRLPA